MKLYIFILLVLVFSFPAYGEDIKSNGGGKLRLIDISMDALFVGGWSTVNDNTLQNIQGGGHDPRKRGFTVQNIELSLTGAVDPYLNGEAHIVYFLYPLT